MSLLLSVLLRVHSMSNNANGKNVSGTVEWEIFTLKIIRMKNFPVVKFSWFRLIREYFLTVDDCNMDEHLETC